ncbi:unnamed protein product [Brassicogethes aeneus]|uniref:Reverse transcriptase domain-containing protein n=1 Tax=Brassicogethes aeneus TaxID=1431903 RepID=A0A9P0BHD4_BRAAE|nr:unnamed protein product [Brassicogethes aeneus]
MPKKQELKLRAQEEKADVLLISETSFQAGVTPKIAGFRGYSVSRLHNQGGGVAIYIKHNIDHCRTLDVNTNIVETHNKTLCSLLLCYITKRCLRILLEAQLSPNPPGYDFEDEDNEDIRPTTSDEVKSIISSLKPRTASDPEGIPNKALKLLPERILTTLKDIINTGNRLKALIAKMSEAGIKTDLIKLTQSYLHRREFKVKVQVAHLSKKRLEREYHRAQYWVRYYLTFICRTSHSSNRLTMPCMQIILLSRFEEWAERWRIKVNPAKTQAIIISKGGRTLQTNLNYEGINIHWANQVKYLGETNLDIANTPSHLLCCSSPNGAKTHISKLEVVQNRFLRNVPCRAKLDPMRNYLIDRSKAILEKCATNNNYLAAACVDFDPDDRRRLGNPPICRHPVHPVTLQIPLLHLTPASPFLFFKIDANSSTTNFLDTNDAIENNDAHTNPGSSNSTKKVIENEKATSTSSLPLISTSITSTSNANVSKAHVQVFNAWLSVKYSSKYIGQIATAFAKLSGNDGALTLHASRKYHQNAIKACEDFIKTYENPALEVINQVYSQRMTQVLENGNRLRPIIETIILCGRQNIALRGHRDDGVLKVQNSIANDGNFKPPFTLSPTYISKTTQNDLIDCCKEEIPDKLIGRVKRAIFYSVIFDETSDAAHIEQLSLNAYDSIREDDVDNNQKRLTGIALGHSVIDLLQKFKLPLENCVGIGTDNCSVMASDIKGAVQEIIKCCTNAKSQANKEYYFDDEKNHQFRDIHIDLHIVLHIPIPITSINCFKMARSLRSGKTGDDDEQYFQSVMEKIFNSEDFLSNLADKIAVRMVNSLENEIKVYKEKVEALDKQVKDMSKIIEQQEQFTRKNNMTIYGLPKQNGKKLDEKLCTLFDERLGIQINPIDIEFCYRLKAKEGKESHVFVRFCRYKNKNEIFKNKSKLVLSRITEKTETLIDLILVSDISLVRSFGNLSIEVSDHDLVYCTTNCTSNTVPFKKTFRNFSKINFPNFTKDLEQLPLHNILYLDNVDDKVDFLNHHLINLFNFHAPYKTIEINKPYKLWLTDNIKFLIKLRDKAKIKFKKTKLGSDWEYFKQLRNFTAIALRNKKRAYFNFKLNNKNPKVLWKELKNLNIKSNKNNILPDHLRYVNLINNFFINSVPVSNVNNDDLINYYLGNTFQNISAEFSFSLVSQTEILETINKIKSNAVGFDEININMVKYSCPTILPYVTNIINTCLLENVIPVQWKEANVMPLPKISEPKELKDLRPVTCDSHKTTALVLLDFTKAFDTINHKLLLSILHFIGLGGPLLFTIYRSNFPNCITYCNHHMYADDTQLYLLFESNKVEEAMQKISIDLNSIDEISKKHSLFLNPGKSKVLLFGNKTIINNLTGNLDFNLSIENVQLPIVQSAVNLV